MKKTILLVTLLALTTVGVSAKSHSSLTSHLLHTPNFQLRSAEIDSTPATTIYTVSGLRQAGNTASFARTQHR